MITYSLVVGIGCLLAYFINRMRISHTRYATIIDCKENNDATSVPAYGYCVTFKYIDKDGEHIDDAWLPHKYKTNEVIKIYILKNGKIKPCAWQKWLLVMGLLMISGASVLWIMMETMTKIHPHLP